MSFAIFAFRSLTHYWRAHAGTVMAAAVGTAVLTGALIVGDSVRHSLLSITEERLGSTQYALIGGDRFFRDDLPGRVAAQPGFSANFSGAHAVLLLPGIVIREVDDARAPHAQIVGVTQDFWDGKPPELNHGDTAINAALAEKLGASAGDQIRIRLSKPGILPLDAPLGSKSDSATIIRATVREVLPDRGLGRFGLDANQAAPFNAFLPIGDLQEALKQPGRANLLLIAGDRHGNTEQAAAEAALSAAWTLDDAQIRRRDEPALNFTELSTPRVFFDDAYADRQIESGAQGVVTYFVNAIRCNGNATPYSMVTGAGASLTDPDLKDDEIELNAWAAEDLKANVGDRVEIEFYVAGLLRQLDVKTATFKLKAIVPIDGAHADRGLMPEFPGIADVDTTHDWDSSIPIDMKKIRDKDEAYWKQYRGTPKAFITLNRGLQLWKNRFGTYTALRFPFQKNASSARFLADATPQRFGLSLLPVKAMGAGAAAEGTDFGGLFLGFSFFLIAAAMLLMSLVFQFGIESRSAETGLLLAIGFTPRRVRALLLLEGTLLATIGSGLGVAGATFYARAMLQGLATRWNAAVGTSALEYHAEAKSLAIGYFAGVLVAVLTIFFAVRRQSKRTARELLAADASTLENGGPHKRSRKMLTIAAICTFAALGLAIWALAAGTRSSAEIFFSAGALLLIGSLLFIRQLFRGAESTDTGEQATSGARSRWIALGRLGVRGCSRRGGRSAAVAALLACGAFLVAAVGANRQDPAAHASENSSGTGGFEYYAESTLPIFEDLNTKKGREAIGVPDGLLEGVSVFAFRVHKGDEASCLNLNRANHPRILGMPQSLIQRGGFTFASLLDPNAPKDHPWNVLNSGTAGTAAIPAVCDDQALTYILGKKLGDTLEISDEHGIARQLQFVGTLDSSILQGSVLISESNFLKLYPSQSGYNVFLIDANGPTGIGLDKALSKALADEGFDPISAPARLASFNAVENTYLSTFAALGSLGMLLGSLGLGVVVLRNMLERQSELAVLRAIGFSRRDIGWLVLSEHAWLLVLGLAAGTVSALIAVAPALQSASVSAPWLSLAAALLSVFGFGLLAALAAAAWMLHRPILAALRSE